MNTKYDFAEAGERAIVYVRRVEVESLPEELQDEVRREAGDLESVYAVHDAEGARIALVRERGMAFALARLHDMTPVSAH